jgi:phosphoglycolate phosphatase
MAHLSLRGHSLGLIHGVLFDKDGTLSHSEPHLIELADARIDEILRVFASRGASSDTQVQLQGLLKRAMGRCDSGLIPDGTLAVASRQHNLLSTATIFCLFDLSWPQALVLAEEIFDSVDHLHKQNATEAPLSARTPLPHSKELLNELHNAGVICAVISNDTRHGIKQFLQDHGLSDFITGIWSADDTPCKPDPGAVHGLCKKLHLDPSQCALIGDADSDLLMARRAGIAYALGYVAGWNRTPDLTSHQHLIHHWQELKVEQAQ